MSEKPTEAEGLPKRWSARRKLEVVLRRLQGEDIGEVSREIRNLPTSLRHVTIQFSEPSFRPLAGSAPSAAVTGIARLIQTSAGRSAALGGPPTKRSGRAA